MMNDMWSIHKKVDHQSSMICVVIEDFKKFKNQTCFLIYAITSEKYRDSLT